MPNAYRRRYQFSAEDRRRGGLKRAQQPSFYDMCLSGWEAACGRHGKKAMLAIIRPKEGRQKVGAKVRTAVEPQKAADPQPVLKFDTPSVLKFDTPRPKPEGVMAHVTLCRVSGSHCGEHVYVFWDGREIGQLHRTNWPADAQEPRWSCDYYGDSPVHLSGTASDVYGVLRIAEHHAACPRACAA